MKLSIFLFPFLFGILLSGCTSTPNSCEGGVCDTLEEKRDCSVGLLNIHQVDTCDNCGRYTVPIRYRGACVAK